MNRLGKMIALILILGLGGAVALAQGFKDLEKRVVEKTLPNGLKVIILPRPEAPVISMVTYADVGSVDENQNATGLAHIFEHMAFKGTTTIGTKDYPNNDLNEREAMKKEDAAFLALRAERIRRPHPDPEKLKQLETAFEGAKAKAKEYVKANEIGAIIEKVGGQGLNAFTNFDQTVYHYSLPSNKLELWACLESDRFTHPVLREFYTEVSVIREEKRMGESQPTGRLIDDYLAMAYKASMYRSMVIGHMSDLMSISRPEAEAWFKKYYGAKNLTAVIVGDVDPAKALPLLEKYLGRIPAGEKPGPVVTQEPPQRAEKRIIMEDPAQPILILGYHRGFIDEQGVRHPGDITDPDNATYQAVSDILGGGRSSRLYKALVKEKKLALAAGAMPALGDKYPGLFLVFAVPNKGKTNAECEKALYEELERVKKEPVSAEELEGFKARAKSRFLSGLNNNMGLAMALATSQNMEGDWREAFTELDKIDKVTAADVQRIAQKMFVRSNLSVGMIETATAAK